ncbi:hypothetical protein [Pseudomonas aeruginosa]|uniref:hypothetical protein n=1 Tax=Pseudomonas aeruginosa TaxID=287 RepID=UPI00053D15F3|nr:hypothetical protein [Pseudomonas aeruginosa]UVN14191.1 hypothetical protein FBPa47_0066 [Pseudomonas phage vB_PeaS_FBPa47]MCO3120578.1 hypothetical protein [Pseudomonas aeruginosa]MDJ1511514.1 hypothetical protein [Pseudomonas aeruginosa]MDV6927540.1 hypothetical protein [Pseudomonas aeruginosa]HCF0038566.1 hypothetical protein [Pseudomonas aeruginosa]
MTNPIVQSISDEQLAELDELTAKLTGDWWVDWDSSYALTASPSNIQSLIARLRAAEAELSLWRPIMDEVERRAEKEWCLQDKRDFTVTIQYDDYVDIDAAMERTP